MIEVGYSDDYGVQVLVFFDSQTHEWLEIQGQVDFSSAAPEPFESYCLVKSGAITHYGGVRGWTLTDQELVLYLTPEAASALLLEEEVSIPISQQYLSLVKEKLEGILPEDLRSGEVR